MTEEEINDIELQVKAFLSLYRYSLWVVVGDRREGFVLETEGRCL